MTLHVLVIVVAAGILFGMFELLRRGQLKEKYAVLWVLVGIAVAVLGIAPGILNTVARPFHVHDPPNLLLFAADVVLLLVIVHLSWESSRLEDETRALAEEVALLRHMVEQNRLEQNRLEQHRPEQNRDGR